MVLTASFTVFDDISQVLKVDFRSQ